MAEANKRQVLLLDDEKLLVDIYRQKLEHSGYVVTPFYSGDDALAALRNGYRPDAMLFDITMPEGMSGYEFLDRVQTEQLSPHSVKVVLTNEGQDAEIARVVELGAHAHWLKSELLPIEIVRSLTRMLDNQ